AVVNGMRYNAAGRLAGTQVNGGTWSCISYDARGRVTQRTYPAYGGHPARTVTYNYKVGGDPRVTSVTDATGTITTRTDTLGRVIEHTDVWGKTTTSEYTQTSRLDTQWFQGGWLDYTYDPVGRVDGVRFSG